jgi:acid stress chaperone HdeA
MKNIALLAIGISIVLTGSATADTPAMTDKTATAAAKSTKSIKPMQLTCEEFLSYDEVTRPQIVFWSEGMNGKGKPNSGVIDVERTNSLVPVLVEDCRQEPKTSYWTKMKEEFKKHF